MTARNETAQHFPRDRPEPPPPQGTAASPILGDWRAALFFLGIAAAGGMGMLLFRDPQFSEPVPPSVRSAGVVVSGSSATLGVLVASSRALFAALLGVVAVGLVAAHSIGSAQSHWLVYLGAGLVSSIPMMVWGVRWVFRAH